MHCPRDVNKQPTQHDPSNNQRCSSFTMSALTLPRKDPADQHVNDVTTWLECECSFSCCPTSPGLDGENKPHIGVWVHVVSNGASLVEPMGQTFGLTSPSHWFVAIVEPLDKVVTGRASTLMSMCVCWRPVWDAEHVNSAFQLPLSWQGSWRTGHMRAKPCKKHAALCGSTWQLVCGWGAFLVTEQCHWCFKSKLKAVQVCT